MLNLPLAVATGGLEAGVHLRWQFDSSLGFPSAASPRSLFTIFRTRHREPAVSIFNSSGVVLSSAYTGAGTLGSMGISLEATAKISKATIGSVTVIKIAGRGTVTYTFSEHICFAKVDLLATQSGRVSVIGYDKKVAVAEAHATVTASLAKPVAISVTIRADRFSKIAVTLPPKTGIVAISFYTPESLNKQLDWKKITGIGLPTSLAQAKGRLQSSTVDHYASGIADLVATSRKLMAGTATETLTDATESPGVSWNIDYAGLLLAASIDAPIARMVGLLYVDTEPAVVAGVDLYDYKVEATWNGVTYAWICVGVRAGTPTALKRPAGVTLEQTTARPVSGTVRLGATQSAVGITWTLPTSSSGILLPASSIMYRILRERKARGSWSGFRTITSAPIVPATQSSGSAASYFYIDSPLADAVYRYAVTGQDVFGRVSAHSVAVQIKVQDVTPPPAPQNVRSTQAEESAGAYGLTVSWDWTPDLTSMAPDLKEFLIYYQTVDVQPLTGTITNVTSGANTSILETDLDPTVSFSGYAPTTGSSYLHARGVRYQVTDITISGGGKVMITVSHATVTTSSGAKETRKPGSASAPSSGADRSFLKFLANPDEFEGSFILVRNWSDTVNWQLAATKTASGLSATATITYQEAVAGISLTLSEQSPIGYILLGVASRDASGNLGAVSAPVKVVVTWQGTTTASAFVSSDTYATRADFYGHSYASMTFSSVPDLYYTVYRLTDSMLVAKASPGSDPESATDTELLGWANSGTYDAYFVKVDARDENGKALSDASGAGQITYTDELPGATRNRFLYKVQSYAAGGTNASALSDACLVKTYDVIAPRKPRITSVLGGDRQITLQWTANQEGDFSHYAVYRTTEADVAGDIRRMDLLQDALADVSYSDTSVEGLVDYYYSLVAVDLGPVGDGSDGNISEAATVMGRAYDYAVPEEPTWLRTEWVKLDDAETEHATDETDASLETAVALGIAVQKRDIAVLIQRQDENGEWQAATTWSREGVYDAGSGTWQFSFYDRSASVTSDQAYRAFLMSGAGVSLESTQQQNLNALELV